jgi:hypothetical protein
MNKILPQTTCALSGRRTQPVAKRSALRIIPAGDHPLRGRSTDRMTDIPYTYGYNNPLYYTDPTGHSASYCNQISSSSGQAACQNGTMSPGERVNRLGITLGMGFEDASYEQLYDIYKGAFLTGVALMRAANSGGTFSSAADAIQSVLGQVTINIGDGPDKGNCETIGGDITCNNMLDIQTTVHELGHVFDNRFNESKEFLVSGYIPEELYSTTNGYMCSSMALGCVAHPPSFDNFNPLNATQEEIAKRREEDFADMFMNWVLGQFGGFPNNGFNMSVDEGKMRTWFMNGTGWYPNYGIGNFIDIMGRQ